MFGCLGGHRFVACQGLRFFSLSHARDMLIISFYISNFRYDGNSTLLNLLQEIRLTFNEKNRLLRYKAF